ncbi:helix-turn-helix domain-containing protein [Actinacidiphila glaucinigra]|uniref:helix-turn-helix domain-containing protein n=1 Tax=Actinacidiphila glaucinigra TaxID=235986 RepID=UPI0036E4E2F9
MARPENPVPETAPPALQRFAEQLRSCRLGKGINYREMAKIAHYSASALSQAASGKEFPSWELTRAYISACGADEGAWQASWEETRHLLSQTPDTPRSALKPNEVVTKPFKRELYLRGETHQPSGIYKVKSASSPSIKEALVESTGPESILRVLKLMRTRAGQPSLRMLAELSLRNGHPIAKSTLARVFSDSRRLPSLDLTLGVARACNATREEQQMLHHAWVLAARKKMEEADVAPSGETEHDIAAATDHAPGVPPKADISGSEPRQLDRIQLIFAIMMTVTTIATVIATIFR